MTERDDHSDRVAANVISTDDQSAAPEGVVDSEEAIVEQVSRATSISVWRHRLRASPRIFVAILIVLLSAGLLIEVATDVSSLDAASAYWRNAFGSREFLAETLVRGTPLITIALGTMIAIRGGLWNIGAEGQMALGAIGAFVSLSVVHTFPAPLGLLVAFLGAALFGAAWGFVPALLRAYRGVSEILTTLLLNYVALALLEFVLVTWLRGAHRSAIPNSSPIADHHTLPLLWPPTRLHLGLVLVILLAWVVGIFYRSPRGFRIDLLGANPRLAMQAGISIKANLIFLLVSSAAVAGMAGAVQLTGTDHRLGLAVTGGVGYLGLLVAVLGGGRVLATVIAAVAFAALIGGAGGAENLGVPRALVLVIQGLVVLAVVLGRRRSL